MDRPTKRASFDESVTSWFLYFGRKEARDSNCTSFELFHRNSSTRESSRENRPTIALPPFLGHVPRSGLACPQGRAVRRIYSTGNASSSYLLGRGGNEPAKRQLVRIRVETRNAHRGERNETTHTCARGEPDRVLSISRRFSGIVPRSGTVGGTRTRTTSLHRLRWIRVHHDEVQRTCSSMRSFLRFPPASLEHLDSIITLPPLYAALD